MENTGSGINYPIEFMRIAGVILITFTHMRHDFTEGLPYFILEILPKYGTLLLSIISGYLFCMSPFGGNLLQKKIKSLLVPYLIANLAVLVPVLVINLFGYNYLNRLDYDYTLITEGLLSFNSPPINPPTYFIRDLFIIFCLISLLRKNYWALLFILPLLIFGHLLLRWDIAFLFITGFIIRKYSVENQNKLLLNGIGIPLLVLSFMFFEELQLYKYLIAILFFLNVINIKFRFVKTGAYTYLLHLYHCPIMVFTFPILHKIYPNPLFETLSQIGLSILFCYVIFLVIKRFRLSIIAGNRY